MSKMIDHNTPYFQSLFAGRTPDELIDHKPSMKGLSLYHKRNHFLLNLGASTEYTPPSWVEEDNIFPGGAPTNPMSHIEFAATIRHFDPDNSKGDILEFGVACAGTIRDIAPINYEKTVYGFDHFRGLEQSYEEVVEDCSQFPNITLIVKDVHCLDEPHEYGIKKISAVHIDVDICGLPDQEWRHK